jgi:histidinol dehydrogenase
MQIISLNRNEIKERILEIREEISSPPPDIEAAVKGIIKDVRESGDQALFAYTKRFDGIDIGPSTVRVAKEELESASSLVPQEVMDSLAVAAERIREFHKQKMPREHVFCDGFGNELGWLIRPIERVGVYVPGGKAAYPSTVLMTVIPAVVAGVEEIVVVTPSPAGEINPSVLAAAELSGATSIYRIGGAQAIAALAYGTESVPKVDKIVGPGNIYVTVAKKLVFGTVDIDMIAGPSEVLVIADGSCPASWVASDLLAQAEHDELAVPILVTTSLGYASEVRSEVYRMLKGLRRREIAENSVERQGRIFVVEALEDAALVANMLAPEHLEICTSDPRSLLPGIKHAGAIFLGSLSTEAFGDYIAGPSHVLPTGGAARFSSPLSVWDFLRMPSLISISERGFKELSSAVMSLATSEGLEAHALSVAERVGRGKSD